jgi:hypothetical protein
MILTPRLAAFTAICFYSRVPAALSISNLGAKSIKLSLLKENVSRLPFFFRQQLTSPDYFHPFLHDIMVAQKTLSIML